MRAADWVGKSLEQLEPPKMSIAYEMPLEAKIALSSHPKLKEQYRMPGDVVSEWALGDEHIRTQLRWRSALTITVVGTD